MRRRDFLAAPLAGAAVAGLPRAGRAGAAPTAGPAGPVLDERAARELADRILALSTADGMQVSLAGSRRGHTRYAVNRITTAGDTADVSASITARFGRRSASVSTNQLDDEGLRRAVRQAEELARLAPEDPEQMPLLGPQTYGMSDGWHEATAGLGARARAEVAEGAISLARAESGVEAAGFLDGSAGSWAVANSEGLFAWHPSTSVEYSLTVRTADGTGSGWAGVGHRDWAGVDAESLHRRAVDKALRSRAPRRLEPGSYPVVLEPEAVSDLVGLLAFSLSARAADEGRSAFAAPGGGTKQGERIVDPRVTLRSDPGALGAPPFDGQGMALEPVTWIRDGVLENLWYDRFWAEKQGTEPTGFPSTLLVGGGEGSVEDLVAGMDAGVLVTRLWYIRSVDPRTILYTGLTRDGTFWIEDGRIAHPVNNFRWNESPLAVLSALEALGRPVRTGAGRMVPPLRASAFTFSSISEAV